VYVLDVSSAWIVCMYYKVYPTRVLTPTIPLFGFKEFVLLDRNSVTGSLLSVCEGNAITVTSADCAEVVCDCCVPCCTDGEACHEMDLVSSVDALWESGYTRQFFQFSSNATEPYEIIDENIINP
jgi:hypothetical protein